MREYVVVPPPLLADELALRGWIEKAFGYAASLAPKTKKPAKKTAKLPPKKATKKPVKQ